MLERVIKSVEPYGLILIILAGASLAGWVQFVNSSIIGVITVFMGALFVLRRVVQDVKQTVNNQE